MAVLHNIAGAVRTRARIAAPDVSSLSPERRREGPSAELLATMYERYKSLLRGNGHAAAMPNAEAVIDGIFDSNHIVDARERFRLYNMIPENVLTAHTARMMEIEKLWDFLKDLSPADFARKLDEIKAATHKLVELSYDIIRVYTNDGLLPNFAVSRLVKAAYAGEDVTAIRFDLDVSGLNSGDPTGTHADEYIPEVGDWLHTNVVTSFNIYRLFGGVPPVVVQYPNRTSFALFGPNRERGKKFIEFVMGRLAFYEEDMRAALSIAQAEGLIAPDVDVANFSPTGTIHHTTIHLREFMQDYARRYRLRGIADVPTHEVIAHVLSEMRRVAAETTFLNDHAVADAVRIGGLAVYGDEALPLPLNSEYGSLLEYIRTGHGSIDFGRFGYQNEEDPETRAMMEHPDVALNLKDITSLRQPNGNGGGRQGGGAIENLSYWVERFVANPALAQKSELFHLFKAEVENMARLVLNLGEEARRAFNFTPTMKSTRRIRGENADFFMEQIGLMNRLLRNLGYERAAYDVLATIEVDDGRAFGRAFPSKDGVDGNFQMIKKLLFDTARQMKMFPPIVAAEGDQIRVAISSMGRLGDAIEPEAFLRAYQRNLRNWHRERGYHFQPYAKVKAGRRMMRLPVWTDRRGSYVAQKERPPGFVPFMKVLTATAVWTLMPDLTAGNAASQVNSQVRQGFRYIDKFAKGQRGYHKEGLARLPVNYRGGDLIPPSQSKQGAAHPAAVYGGGGGSGRGIFSGGPCYRKMEMDHSPTMIGSVGIGLTPSPVMSLMQAGSVGMLPGVTFSPLNAVFR